MESGSTVYTSVVPSNVKAQDLGGASYAVVSGDLRLASHRIADFVYETASFHALSFQTEGRFSIRGHCLRQNLIPLFTP